METVLDPIAALLALSPELISEATRRVPRCPVPEVVTSMRTSWAAFLALHEEIGIRAAGIREAHGVDYFMQCGVDLEGGVQRICEKLVQLARKEFSPVGVTLEIGVSDIPTTTPERFDPVVAWSVLRSKFGDREKMTFAAYHKLAMKIVSEFRLDADKPVQVVGGRASLSVAIYGCRICELVLDYRDSERVAGVLDQLFAVAEWAGIKSAESTENFEALRKAMSKERKEVLPRTHLGDLILVIPYKSKYEFRLNASFSEHLICFLGQYEGFADE